MHIDTFLEQTKPHITLPVLTDTIHLSSAKIHLTTIIRIIYKIAILRIIDSQAQTIIAYHDMSTTIGIDSRYIFGACTFNMARHIPLKDKHTGMGRGDEDTSFTVLTNIANHTDIRLVLEITLHGLTIET